MDGINKSGVPVERSSVSPRSTPTAPSPTTPSTQSSTSTLDKKCHHIRSDVFKKAIQILREEKDENKARSLIANDELYNGLTGVQSLQEEEQKKLEIEIAKRLATDAFRNGKPHACSPHRIKAIDHQSLQEAFHSISSERKKAAMTRTGSRIEKIAKAQRKSLGIFDFPIEGGVARQLIAPIEHVGCWFPGTTGSVRALMTSVITAKAAGVTRVSVTVGLDSQALRAAAYISGADQYCIWNDELHCVCEYACGLNIFKKSDVIVSFDSQLMRELKKLLAGNGSCNLILLRCPRDLFYLANASSDSDYLADEIFASIHYHARKKPGRVMVVSDDKQFLENVKGTLAQLEENAKSENGGKSEKPINGVTLPLADSKCQIFFVESKSMEEGIDLAEFVQPEVLMDDQRVEEALGLGPYNLISELTVGPFAGGGDTDVGQIQMKACEKCSRGRNFDADGYDAHRFRGKDIDGLIRRPEHNGSLFMGPVVGGHNDHWEIAPVRRRLLNSANVSLLDFIRIRTSIQIDKPEECQTLVSDCADLAAVEGLIGHQRSAVWRRTPPLGLPMKDRLRQDFSSSALKGSFIEQSKPSILPHLLFSKGDEFAPSCTSLCPSAVDANAVTSASIIVNEVKQFGIQAVLKYGVKFGDIPDENSQFLIKRSELQSAFESISADQQELLKRTASRIRNFAKAQKDSWRGWRCEIPGGAAHQHIRPVEAAGCYAPGGRYPLPSTVLMTVVTARVAGVENVVVASPHPPTIMKAAAYVAGANCFLAVGGPAAIAAMAYGVGPLPKCDVVVGPGNRYVTAAKSLVVEDEAGASIDMLAGPSEALIIADSSACPEMVASDLLAQAEHDDHARVFIATPDIRLVEEVHQALYNQLQSLPTKETAKNALKNGGVILTENLSEAAQVANLIAPEHLSVVTTANDEVIPLLKHYGALFVGDIATEVLGDYGVGPNHTLPTCGTARYSGGLSVFTFLTASNTFQVTDLSSYAAVTWDQLEMASLDGWNDGNRMAQVRLREAESLNDHPSLPRISARSTKDIHMGLKVSSVEGPKELMSLLRQDRHGLMEYHPVRPLKHLAEEAGKRTDELCKLDANENMYGCCAPVADAVFQAIKQSGHIYPDPSQLDLRRLLANYTERNVEEIVCGSGADDMIQLMIEVVKPKRIVTMTPSFSMYKFFGLVEGSSIVELPVENSPGFKPNYRLIKEEMTQRGCDLVCLVSPNNPTGSSIEEMALVELLELRKAMIIVDEAYVEFSNKRSFKHLLDQHPNLVILRSLSKWAALAGLRCGYALAHPFVTQMIFKVKIPYNLNVAADAAACAVVKNLHVLQGQIKLLKNERVNLSCILRSRFFSSFLNPYASDANFVFCRIGSSSSSPLTLSSSASCASSVSSSETTSTASFTNGILPSPDADLEIAKEMKKKLSREGVFLRYYNYGQDDGTAAKREEEGRLPCQSSSGIRGSYVRISCGRPIDTSRLFIQLRKTDFIGCPHLKRSSLPISAQFSTKPLAILFDLDGVIAEVSESYRKCIIDTANHFGVTLSSKDISAAKAEGNANNDIDLTVAFLRKHGKSVSREDVESQFQLLYTGVEGGKGLRDKERMIIARPLLLRLSSVCPLAIVTGRPRVEANYFLAHWSIQHLFQTLVCMEDAKLKPDKEPVLKALEELNIVSSSSTCSGWVPFIGDTVDDMRAACAADQKFQADAEGKGENVVRVMGCGVLTRTDLDHGDDVSHATASVLYDAGAEIVAARFDSLLPFFNLHEGLVLDAASTLLPRSLGGVALDDVHDDSGDRPCDMDSGTRRGRRACVQRVTKETNVTCTVDLDGKGISEISTGVGFLDHMIDQLAKHGRFDIDVKCQGDLHIDDHHSVEDCAIVLGTAFKDALKKRERGINRFGSAYAPLDESLARCVVDLSGRGHGELQADIIPTKVGTLSTEMIPHFLSSFALAMAATIHIDIIRGKNAHHQVEAAFKAMAQALRIATRIVPGFEDAVPSTKGVL